VPVFSILASNHPRLRRIAVRPRASPSPTGYVCGSKDVLGPRLFRLAVGWDSRRRGPRWHPRSSQVTGWPTAEAARNW